MTTLLLKRWCVAFGILFIVGCSDDNDVAVPSFLPAIAPVSTGSSKGALVAEDGEVILVRTYKDDADNAIHLYYPDDTDVAAYAVIETGGQGAFRFEATDAEAIYGGVLTMSTQSTQGALGDLVGVPLGAIVADSLVRFSLDGAGNLSTQSDGCQMSGSFSETSVSGVGSITLSFSACGDLDGDRAGFIVRDTDDVPASVRLVVTDGTAVSDLLGYQL